MHQSSHFLLTLGGILLLGLLTSAIAKKILLPRVTLLLALGIIIGNDFLGFIPSVLTDNFKSIADLALLMIGFLLGGKLTKEYLRECASDAMWISISAAVITMVFVSAGLYFAGLPPTVSLILGCISSATAPAAIMDIVDESGEGSRFSKLLLSIVALDDIWALFMFCAGMAVIGAMAGNGETSFFSHAFKDIGGALILGLALGFPGAFLTGRVREGKPALTEALGLVFICGGLAQYLDVSYLLSSIVMGMVIANFATHHEYPFHAIEDIEWPLMLIFFILAGASLELTALAGIQLTGIIFIIMRTAGKYAGAKAGGKISGADKKTQTWMGPALLPQAGVPIGMALAASSQLPDYKQTLLSIVIGSTVIFDLFGPILTKIAVNKTK